MFIILCLCSKCMHMHMLALWERSCSIVWGTGRIRTSLFICNNYYYFIEHVNDYTLIRIVAADSIRDLIQTKISDLQVPIRQSCKVVLTCFENLGNKVGVINKLLEYWLLCIVYHLGDCCDQNQWTIRLGKYHDLVTAWLAGWHWT